MAKELVWRLKFSGARAAAQEIARLLAADMQLPADVVVVHAPTASSRLRRRGYDQAQLIARALARELGLPYLSILKRVGQQQQVGAGRQQRLAQLSEAFRVSQPAVIKDTHVLLVDDVLTTGATLEAAAKTLKTAGAKRVSGVVFAQA
jgi:ComF family protein